MSGWVVVMEALGAAASAAALTSDICDQKGLSMQC